MHTHCVFLTHTYKKHIGFGSGMEEMEGRERKTFGFGRRRPATTFMRCFPFDPSKFGDLLADEGERGKEVLVLVIG